MNYESLGAMFKTICEKFPEKNGYMSKKDDVFTGTSYKEAQSIVNRLAAGLNQLGLNKNEKALILSENRMEWALADYAILTLGGVTVPIYPTLLPHHIEYIINHSEGKILFVSNKIQLDKVIKVKDKLTMLEHIVIMENESYPDVKTFNQLSELGKEELNNNPTLLDEKLVNVKGNDLASIIYTSGTTGVPKGVMLTHNNILSNIEGSLEVLKVTEEDSLLSFLPLSHILERMAGHFLATSVGSTIAYAENIETVANNLREVHPTLMIGVPRFFEKVYARVMDSLEEGSPLKKKIFLWAIEVGKKISIYKQKGLPLKGNLKAKYKIADKLVYSKLKERVGGKVRLFVSGGAPLSREIGEFFNAAGLTLLEGYGLTESSPVITVNHMDNFKFGSPGLPIPNVEVVIAEDGEILSRGPHVMLGYYKNEEETKEAIDDDNWLHTGDIGYLDKDGFLYITDRKKNIIVTSGGKNIAPQAIENLLATSAYIDQSVVLGDKRKYCTALIYPNIDKLKSFAKENNIQFSNNDELLSNKQIYDLLRTEIERVSVDLASYETIKKFQLLREELTIESGELTPTLKVKRHVIEQKYQKIINDMYAEDENNS